MNSDIINTIAEGKMTYKCSRDIFFGISGVNVDKLRSDLYQLRYTLCYNEDPNTPNDIIITFIGNF